MKREDEFRVIGEWDWWLSAVGDVLHAATVVYDPNFDVSGEGLSDCGIRSRFCIPGILTRMGAARCKRCCRVTGFPEGVGSPKNDDACRPLVKKRLKEMGLTRVRRRAA